MILIDSTNPFYRNLNTHILSLNEIEAYIFNQINSLNLEDYIYDVDYIDDEDTLGTYSFQDSIIRLNIPRIIEEAKKLYKTNFILEDEILFINLNILEAIFHEIIHSIQNYHLNESDYAYNILYSRELYYTNNMSDEDYNKYYIFFSYERDAMITAMENILHIIKLYYKDKERTFRYFLYNIYKLLILGYTDNKTNIVSPAEKLTEELYHDITATLSNVDTYDRMKLGYQISVRNFLHFKKHKIRKILTKNNLL